MRHVHTDRQQHRRHKGLRTSVRRSVRRSVGRSSGSRSEVRGGPVGRKTLVGTEEDVGRIGSPVDSVHVNT